MFFAVAIYTKTGNVNYKGDNKMLYTERDIDFKRITPLQFEELCFDLLLRFGYKGLTWRQGGADKGRDIEGRLTINNPLVEAYEEKWFFECKHYSKGVPPEQLNSKIAWADAENPKHLVIFASSYLSDGCRHWIELIGKEKPYRIHVLEGKYLKTLILSFPDLVAKYFLDKYAGLLLSELNNWLIHNVLPHPQTFKILAEKLDITKLTPSELAFLWCSSIIKVSEVEEWIEDNEPFSLEFLFHELANFSDADETILSTYEDCEHVTVSSGRSNRNLVYSRYIAAVLTLNPDSSYPIPALYCFVYDSEGEGLEVIIESTGDFATRIRHVSSNARDEYSKITEILFAAGSS